MLEETNRPSEKTVHGLMSTKRDLAGVAARGRNEGTERNNALISKVFSTTFGKRKIKFKDIQLLRAAWISTDLHLSVLIEFQRLQ